MTTIKEGKKRKPNYSDEQIAARLEEAAIKVAKQRIEKLLKIAENEYNDYSNE